MGRNEITDTGLAVVFALSPRGFIAVRGDHGIIPILAQIPPATSLVEALFPTMTYYRHWTCKDFSFLIVYIPLCGAP